MRLTLHHALVFAIVAVALPLSTGCKNGVFDWSSFFPDESADSVDSSNYTDPIQNSASYRQTIAEYAYFDGMRRMRVRGYGIVIDLGDGGSAECPTHIKNDLVQEMYKKRDYIDRPEALISRRDTAVVTIEGEIPAAATEDATFDLLVRALPGTQTTSLEGGWLLPCDLRIYRSTGAAGWIPGRILAEGLGPVFMNPFSTSGASATRSSKREGTIIAGGRVTHDRRVRLLMANPSYQRAAAIANRINARFAEPDDPVADAVSPSEIRLKIPAVFHNDPKHYISLVQHLYITNRPGFDDSVRRKLVKEFADKDAPHVEIALAWESLGRTVLPDVQRFYDDGYPPRSFYSAVAGMRLGDDDAVDALSKHLMNKKGAFRRGAIKVLGSARNSLRAARPLRRALNDDDPRIRVAAYEALRQRHDSSISTFPISSGQFDIDVVRTDSRRMIYAKRTEDRRIAIFGDVRARSPLFFSLPDNSLMLTSDPGDTQVTMVRTTEGGEMLPKVTVDGDVAQMISRLGHPPPDVAGGISGLGVEYASIIFVLSDLVDSGAIDAHFMMESPASSMLPRPPLTVGRPESEL